MQLEEESMQKGKWYGILPNIIPTTTKDDLYKRKFMSFFHSLILNEVFFFFFPPISDVCFVFFRQWSCLMACITHLSMKMNFNTHTLALYKTQHKKMILKWKNAESCFSSPSCIPVHMLCDSLSSWFKFLFCAWIRQETDHWHII